MITGSVDVSEMAVIVLFSASELSNAPGVITISSPTYQSRVSPFMSTKVISVSPADRPVFNLA